VKGGYHSPLEDREVAREERTAGILDECKGLILVFIVEIVKEDSSDSSCFLSMFDVKVLVAPFLKVWIVPFIVTIAALLESLVEVNSIFVVQIGRGEISSQ
jgi:hypothetical protein